MTVRHAVITHSMKKEIATSSIPMQISLSMSNTTNTKVQRPSVWLGKRQSRQDESRENLD